MRPDLFAGLAQRDDSHRILARLANNGKAPPPPRQWGEWNTLLRAHAAAIVALLAAIAAAWAWLQDVGAPAQPLQRAQAQAQAAQRAAPGDPSTQAATIVNEPVRPAPAVAQVKPVAPARPEPRLVRPHPAKSITPPRAQRSEAQPEGDEDVTLLTAMLKHANGQKAGPTPPKD